MRGGRGSAPSAFQASFAAFSSALTISPPHTLCLAENVSARRMTARTLVGHPSGISTDIRGRVPALYPSHPPPLFTLLVLWDVRFPGQTGLLHPVCHCPSRIQPSTWHRFFTPWVGDHCREELGAVFPGASLHSQLALWLGLSGLDWPVVFTVTLSWDRIVVMRVGCNSMVLKI